MVGRPRGGEELLLALHEGTHAPVSAAELHLADMRLEPGRQERLLPLGDRTIGDFAESDVRAERHRPVELESALCVKSVSGVR